MRRRPPSQSWPHQRPHTRAPGQPPRGQQVHVLGQAKPFRSTSHSTNCAYAVRGCWVRCPPAKLKKRKMRATYPTTRLASSAGAGARPPSTTTSSYFPAQVPLNRSPFTQITLHTLSQTQRTRAPLIARVGGQAGTDERSSVVGARKMVSSLSSATCSKVVLVARPTVVAVCAAARVGHPTGVVVSARPLGGRPRARPHRPLAARGFSMCAASASSDACFCACAC